MPEGSRFARYNSLARYRLSDDDFSFAPPAIAPAMIGDLFDDDGDTPNEECGIFGIYAPGEEAARLTFFGLFALQHRGQESAGIAASDGHELRMHKDMGLVTQVFHEDTLARLRGHIAIGHTRYSTTGSSVLRNAQPLQACLHVGNIAVAHNGNLINTEELRAEMQERGVEFETTNDSEVIARLIAEQTGRADACRGRARHDAACQRRVLARDSDRACPDRRPGPQRRPPALSGASGRG